MEKIIINKWIPCGTYIMMVFYNMILVNNDYKYLFENEHYGKMLNIMLNHERIHIMQMKDFCPWIPIGGTLFYIFYCLEFIIKFFMYFNIEKTYYSLSFEREADENQNKSDYFSNRKHFAFLKYIFKR